MLNTTANRCNKKEDFVKYGNAIIGGYKTIISVFQIIAESAKKMNGKVFNKRFQTEIENRLKDCKIGANISISDSYNMGYKTLKIYLFNRDTQINGSTIYFDKEIYHTSIHNCEKAFVNAEGRIVAEGAENECNEQIKLCNEQTEKWEDAIENYDRYKEQVENAVKQLGEALKGLNGFFRPSQIDSYDWEKAIGLH
jgi:hypothetical protein